MLGQLKEKANLVTQTFNSIEGVSCNVVQGAMYAFPNVKMPQKALDAAKVRHICIDSKLPFPKEHWIFLNCHLDLPDRAQQCDCYKTLFVYCRRLPMLFFLFQKTPSLRCFRVKIKDSQYVTSLCLYISLPICDFLVFVYKSSNM